MGERMKKQDLVEKLQDDGFSEVLIEKMLKENYQEFHGEDELKDLFQQQDSFQEILQSLADDYSMEEIAALGVGQEIIQSFLEYLKRNHLTIENAKAINQYSNGSNMILAIKRGTTSKETIYDQILSDLSEKLKIRRFYSDREYPILYSITGLYKTTS